MTALRAALNFALDYGHATSDLAWHVALRPARGEGANGRRTLYLDRDQRRELLRHTSEELVGFLTGMTLLRLRPCALAALTVSRFNKRLGVLTVGKHKAGNDRSLPLPKHLVAFFTEASRDELANAPLPSRTNGKPWSNDAWKKSIKEAVLAAKLPEETAAYTLRHSVITDLVTREGLDLLTVAQLSGTSVVMIEKHDACGGFGLHSCLNCDVASSGRGRRAAVIAESIAAARKRRWIRRRVLAAVR